MNDYDEQLTGSTLPELSDEERLRLESELEQYDQESAVPEPEPQIAAPEATAPVQQEPEIPVEPRIAIDKELEQRRRKALDGA